MDWMIYGANGFTGRLVAREAVRRGLRPVLAGRSENSIKPLADELGLEFRLFELSDPADKKADFRTEIGAALRRSLFPDQFTDG